MRGAFKQGRSLAWIQSPQNYISLFLPFLSLLFAFSFILRQAFTVWQQLANMFFSIQDHQEERDPLPASIPVPKLMLTALFELYAHPWTKYRIQGYSILLLACPS